jgi:acyl-CoA synthetase (AMP-forming)/AMP-acid ligase II
MMEVNDDFFNVPHSGNGLKVGSLAEICYWRGVNQSNKVAYRFLHNGLDEYEELTYGELLSQIQSIASCFSSILVSSEADRALLVFPPGLNYISAFYACLYGGVIAVPAYPMLSHSDSMRLRVIINDCHPRYILTSSQLKDVLVKWLKDEGFNLELFQIIVTDELSGGDAVMANCGLAFLQYTSGSTGNPKGVMVTNQNLVHNSKVIYRKFEHNENSEVVSWLPPFHDMGLVGGIIQPLFAGFTANIMSPMTFLRRPMRWLQAISRYSATSSGGPNFSYKLCVKHFNPKQLQDVDLSSWNVAFNGAEPIQAETLNLFKDTFSSYGFSDKAFYPCYGLAEMTLFVAGGSPRRVYPTILAEKSALSQKKVITADSVQLHTELVSSGEVIENKVVIVDPDNHQRLAEREIGEIWVAGGSVALGYWRRKEETEQVFHAYTQDGQGPYLRTGDFGCIDGDQLFVTGRLKEIIIINGKNYFPSDIEQTVQGLSSVFRSDACAAISVEKGGGEQLVIVQEIERSKKQEVSISDLQEEISQKCFEQHGVMPSDIVFVDQSQIPKTTSGKVKRLEVRLNYLAGNLQSLR